MKFFLGVFLYYICTCFDFVEKKDSPHFYIHSMLYCFRRFMCKTKSVYVKYSRRCYRADTFNLIKGLFL